MGIVTFLQLFSSSLTYICILALATFAITLIFKTSATTNFAQGSVAALGCHFVFFFLDSLGWNIWLSLLVGIIGGILVGVFIDLVIFRNGRNVNLVGKQIITMGLVTVIANIIPFIFKLTDPKRLPSLGNNISYNIPFMGEFVPITLHSIVCVVITIVVLGILFLLLRFSKWGLGVRTTASNEYVAQMMGVNTYAITAISWGIAGGLGTLAAVMYSGGIGEMYNAYFMTEFQVNAFLAGIMGGFGTFWGPVVCALIIPVLKNFINIFGFLPGMTKIMSWSTVIVYVIIMIVIYIKPNGLFGKKIAKKV